MVNKWSVPFINREEELATIQKHLQAWGSRCVIFISGDGGIGKTRLLSEVEQRFSDLERLPLRVPSIMDFDDEQYKVSGNVGFSLARQLDVNVFEPYFEASRELQLAEERWGSADSPLVVRKALAISRLFIENFNEVSNKSRVLLRIDTTDVISNDDTLSLTYMFDLASHLENMVMLIAGRNAEELYDTFGAELGDDAILISLQPFTLSNSRDYLALKQQMLKVTFDIEWMDKLFILAGGLPVLIDLAIEWAQAHRPLPEMENLSLSELEQLQQQAESDDSQAREHLESLQEQFKREIVMPIAQLHSPLDHLKLVLSKVPRLDLEGVMEMLNLNRQEATDLVDKATLSVAIKVLPDERLKLHDVVEELIKEHVWKELDPSGSWEQRDNRRAIDYLTRKSMALLTQVRKLKQHEYQVVDAADPSEVLTAYTERRDKEIDFWSLRTERLRRQLESNVYKGYELFGQDYKLARTESSGITYRSSLLSEIEPYADFEHPSVDINGNCLSEEDRVKVQRDIADEATYSGMYARAAQIYENLLTKIAPDSVDYISTLNGQANLLVRAGKLRDALRVNERALKLSQDIGSEEWKIKSALSIGWVHRLMGHLGAAQQHYNQALLLAMEHDDDERIALIYSQIAYVHALQHQNRALTEIQRAITMWQELVRKQEGNRFHLGLCYNVAGEICLELERPEEALVYFELSWNIFDIEEAHGLSQERQALEWKSKSRSGRGFAYWQLASTALRKEDEQAARNYLSAARDDLEWATEHAAPFDNPLILNRLGETYFLLEKYDQSAKVWQQSMKQARQIGDAFTELHSLSDLARLAFYHSLPKFPRWRDFETYYNRDYRRKYRGLYFEILHGLFHTYLGHLALKGKQIDEAIRLYDSGLSILAPTSTYASFNLAGQLEFMEEEVLPQINPETVREIAGRLQRTWIERTQDITALAYFRKWMRWETSEQKDIGDEP